MNLKNLFLFSTGLAIGGIVLVFIDYFVTYYQIAQEIDFYRPLPSVLGTAIEHTIPMTGPLLLAALLCLGFYAIIDTLQSHSA